MHGKTFVDTNVLIYAHDADAGRKHEAAKAVLRELWAERSGTLSMQVLQEFYVNVTRKIPSPLPPSSARGVVNAYAVWCAESITVADLPTVFQIEDDARVSFWDALIVAAAARSGAVRLLSENFPGPKIAGLVVENPFAATIEQPRDS